MTYEEALYQITNYGLDEGPEELAEAVEIFRKATEKQIPKKIKNGIFAGKCECGNIVFADQNFCPKCGQALKWSDEK